MLYVLLPVGFFTGYIPVNIKQCTNAGPASTALSQYSSNVCLCLFFMSILYSGLPQIPVPSLLPDHKNRISDFAETGGCGAEESLLYQ